MEFYWSDYINNANLSLFKCVQLSPEVQRLKVKGGLERINELIKKEDGHNINSSHIKGGFMLKHSSAATMVTDLHRAASVQPHHIRIFASEQQ